MKNLNLFYATCLYYSVVVSTEVDGFSPSHVTITNVGALMPKNGSILSRIPSSLSPISPLQAVAFDATFSSVNTFFETQPYLAAFLTCSVKASAADYIAQSKESNDAVSTSTSTAIEEGTVSPAAMTTAFDSEIDSEIPLSVVESLDVARNLGFLMYGGLYTGLAQNYLYNVLYPMWFGFDNSWSAIFEKVVADNLIFAPFLCLPMAYAFKAAFSSDQISLETLQQGLEKYIRDVTNQGLLLKYWSIWIPVQFLTFGLIPPHFRVAFVAAVSFFWFFLLSTISASAEAAEPKKS